MQTHVANTPLNANGEPIKLPDNLETLPKAENFPIQRHRWNTNEEIAAILISFDRHTEWQSKEVKIRPKSGSMLLYSRKKVRYRRDGYCWKKRKDGKTTREDHMKLKVQGTECIYGCYVHSAILPTFHRRCYWLLQNPDIVLVHYLNVPYPDDNKLAVIAPSLALWGDKKEWTKEELVSQLKPMFFSEDEPDVNNELEISTAETVEAIVGQLMDKQRVARQAALVKQLECGCPEAGCAGGKPCSHSMRRISSAKPIDQTSNPSASIASTSNRQSDNNNQVTSTTGTGSILLTTNSHPPRVYSRDSRLVHHSHSSIVTHTSNGNIPTSNPTTTSPPLVLSLSHIQGGSGLLILNSSASNSTTNSIQQSLVSPLSVTSFVCNTSDNGRNSLSRSKDGTQYKTGTLVLKQEIMDTNSPSSCRHSSESSYTINSNTRTLTNMKVVNRLSRSDDNNDNISTVLLETLTNGKKDRNSPKIHLNNRMNMVCSAPATPSKYVDHNDERSEKKSHNIYSDTLVLFGTESGGSLISQSDGSSIVNGTIFNETLDLSHEDIQKTLSANMPLCSSDLDQLTSNNSIIQSNNVVINTDTVQVPGEELSPNDVIVSEINPMDFIENCDVVVSPTHVVDDDVFVNLDAFDMLGEFAELEALDPNTVSTHNLNLLHIEGKTSVSHYDNISQKNESNSPPSGSQSDGQPTASITDFSPEWAYPEGGVKVLVTGPWHSTGSSYTVLFDSFPVPTTLVQSGVLRCYCPAHEAGLATLQVACDGFVISNSVIFEYKLPPREERISAPEPKVEPTSEGLLQFTLLHRLESMDDKLQIKQEPDGLDNIEDSALFTQPNFEDRLVTFCQARIGRKWKLFGDDSNQFWTGSHRGMTLLHLAASLGYSRLVCIMLHWRAENSSILLECEVDALSQDDDGFTPLMWACSRGHSETAILLYRWNHTALNVRNKASQTALDCAIFHQHNNLVKEIRRLESKREITDCNGGSAFDNSVHVRAESGASNFSAGVSPATSISSLSSIASSSRLHDGVFLRPGAVTRSEAQKFKVMQVNNSNQSENVRTFSEKDISIPMDIGGSPSPSRGFRNDSLLSQKLVKRSSVDSGINMTSVQSSDSIPSIRPRNRNSGKENPKLSRFDRSMSMPLSSINPGDLSYHNGIDIGTRQLISRRMDYALCEVAGGPRSDSPLIDVEAMSDEETEQINKEQANVVGDQDVRVYALAEQIIAAMPDRIKNESEDMIVEGSPGIADIATPSDCLMEPLLDLPPPVNFEPTEFNFEYSDHSYRYYDVGTPCSSLSPASSSCLQSPRSLPLADSPSPPPTTADFCEFLQASANLCERDFNNLTLSDREQRELYEAAKIIQKAYRLYKGRQKIEEQDKEKAAAVCIQNYYRRYKQYAYFKQMDHAAMVIQHGFRSYRAHKRFKKGAQEAGQGVGVAVGNNSGNLNNYSRTTGGKGSPGSLKRTYSQRRQHQAARKIQQFMRQSKNKLQSERAARERQAVQPPVAVPQRSQYPGDNLQYMLPGNQARSNNSQSPPSTKSEDFFLESLFGDM